MSDTILDVVNLKKYFYHSTGLFSSLKKEKSVIPAVDDVSFYLKEKETLGLVGESGCGKTTVGKLILRLIEPTDGKIVFNGMDMRNLRKSELRKVRSQMQMIFQDLDAALNPRMKVKDILKEAITVYEDLDYYTVNKRITELMNQVNLKKSKLGNYPDELSGGEKRRVGIARVLAVKPRLIIADEPTSALDVSIQAQVINLLRDLQEELGLSYLFISHDLRLVELISDKVAVMYMGRIVEMGLSDRIAHKPMHPYTNVLWSSLTEGGEKTISRGLSWQVFDFGQSVTGCRFHPRCEVFKARGNPKECTDPQNEPKLTETGTSHYVACHFPLL
ncbi:MAG: ABC transporter ATP-binding protein [Nitrospirae bacterium]|nr:ABC transporter ATP-binding protein [Nitrospirota bacterium]